MPVIFSKSFLTRLSHSTIKDIKKWIKYVLWVFSVFQINEKMETEQKKLYMGDTILECNSNEISRLKFVKFCRINLIVLFKGLNNFYKNDQESNQWLD